MSYYENQAQAQAQAQAPTWQSSRPSWEGRAGTTPVQTHFPRSHASDPSDLTARFTAQMKSEDPAAFGAQIDEVDRAVDNLVKSGKMFAPQRRDSLPVLSPRGFPEHDARMVTPMTSRHYSVQEFDVMRSQSAANLQNFYATQRFQPRQTEAEQMMQAKRRLAAQRERDLRNYHQEQQYNRTLLAEISTYGKDRVMSPSAMTEDERRELIARQHRALYAGNPDGHQSEDGSHLDENSTSRGTNIHSNGPSAPGSNAGGTRGPSPSSAFDPFGHQQNGSVDTTPVQTPATEQGPHAGQSNAASPTRSRTNSASSPSSKSASFSLFDNAGTQAQSSRTSASSPGGSPPRAQRVSTTPVTSSGVAPIGTRPTQNQNSAINNKRSTTPLPSPLSYGFAQENDPFNNISKERSSPAPSNNSTPGGQGADGLGWSKVWGPSNKSLGTVASVWG